MLIIQQLAGINAIRISYPFDDLHIGKTTLRETIRSDLPARWQPWPTDKADKCMGG